MESFFYGDCISLTDSVSYS